MGMFRSYSAADTRRCFAVSARGVPISGPFSQPAVQYGTSVGGSSAGIIICADASFSTDNAGMPMMPAARVAAVTLPRNSRLLREGFSSDWSGRRSSSRGAEASLFVFSDFDLDLIMHLLP